MPHSPSRLFPPQAIPSLHMKNTVIALFVGLLLPIANANAMVTAMPAFYDFGSVPKGQMGSATIWFQNDDPRPINSFFVNCMDGAAEYQCISYCYSIPAYG